MAGREKGSEIESMQCPNCGTERPVHEQADGSKAVDSCPTCWPAEPEPEKASAVAAPAREKGTPAVKEES